MLNPRRNKKSSFLMKRRQERQNLSTSQINDTDKSGGSMSLDLSLSNLQSLNDSFGISQNSARIFENIDGTFESPYKTPPQTERLHICRRDSSAPHLVIPKKNEKLPEKSSTRWYAYTSIAIAAILITGFFYIKRRNT